MSAGRFQKSKYSDDNTNIRPIRVLQATLDATFGTTANVAPSAGVDTKGAAKVSGGKRSYGVHARYATITFEDDPPTGYAAYQYLRIPILTQTVFDGIVENSPVTYLGKTGKVVSTTKEKIR